MSLVTFTLPFELPSDTLDFLESTSEIKQPLIFAFYSLHYRSGHRCPTLVKPSLRKTDGGILFPVFVGSIQHPVPSLILGSTSVSRLRKPVYVLHLVSRTNRRYIPWA
jgi:hypothetical protein